MRGERKLKEKDKKREERNRLSKEMRDLQAAKKANLNSSTQAIKAFKFLNKKFLILTNDFSIICKVETLSSYPKTNIFPNLCCMMLFSKRRGSLLVSVSLDTVGPLLFLQNRVFWCWWSYHSRSWKCNTLREGLPNFLINEGGCLTWGGKGGGEGG